MFFSIINFLKANQQLSSLICLYCEKRLSSGRFETLKKSCSFCRSSDTRRLWEQRVVIKACGVYFDKEKFVASHFCSQLAITLKNSALSSQHTIAFAKRLELNHFRAFTIVHQVLITVKKPAIFSLEGK